MREVPLNKEARLHRLHNQRRIAYSLIERARTLLAPGVPFSRELHELFRSRGKFGSKDRRLYRELIYTYLRYQPWLDPLYREQERFMDALVGLATPTEEVKSLYPTLPNKHPPIGEEDGRHRAIGRHDHEIVELLPSWFPKHLSRPVTATSFVSLVSRPPLWLRVQSGEPMAALEELRAAAGAEGAKQVTIHPVVPNCIQAPADLAIGELACYREGRIEIQDISSQLLLQLLPGPLRGQWLDACAGAGGKTLQLARLLQPSGQVSAYDTRQSALKELRERVVRSGFRNVSSLAERPSDQEYDGVLVDAPCSGSGTWRRHPYLMRQIREKDIFAHAERQLSLLKHYGALVRPGGWLVYCTCSLSRHENEEVAERFLAARSGAFVHFPLALRFGLADHGRGITVYPEDFNGDGLYVTAFRRAGS